MTTPNGPILFNSSTGSDTAASGLGPTTAVSGTGASSTASSATVDLSADTPDLSGVSAGDLFWIDSSSGRQFSIISSVNDGADTVTCDDTFANTESGRNWGIGGKRASWAGSRRIIENDPKDGWIIECESGYTETVSSRFLVSVSGSTSGKITYRATPGAATLPIFSFSQTSQLIALLGNYCDVIDLIAKKITTDSGSNQSAFQTSGTYCSAIRCQAISDGTYKVSIGFKGFAETRGCYVDGSNSYGIELTARSQRVHGCHVANCTSHGIYLSSTDHWGGSVEDNVVHDCGGDGIHSNASTAERQPIIRGNVLDNNTSDGIEIAGTALQCLQIYNNVMTRNGGYGCNFSSATAVQISMADFVDYNAFGAGTYANTSGQYQTFGGGDNDVTLGSGVDPYTDKANDDYTTSNATLVDAGFPQSIPGV